MQKSYIPATPQKRVHFLTVPQDHLKELSPVPCMLNRSHAKASKLQLMQSPLPVHLDLFSQLLGSGIKTSPSATFINYEILEEQTFEDFDVHYSKESESIEHESSDSQEENEEQENENDNDIKKRKRKSTAQIKMLKQQLDIEGNWTKEKIAEMSDITGLSQSQVYKWWWDQKKKSLRIEMETYNKISNKRKMIKKDLSKRPSFNSFQSSKLNCPYEIEDQAISTKIKMNIDLEELPETQRKVNKRLIFS